MRLFSKNRTAQAVFEIFTVLVAVRYHAGQLVAMLSITRVLRVRANIHNAPGFSTTRGSVDHRYHVCSLPTATPCHAVDLLVRRHPQNVLRLKPFI